MFNRNSLSYRNDTKTEGAEDMTAMYEMQMNTCTDACFAPACQSAHSGSTHIYVLDAVVVAVSFLFRICLVKAVRIVRIILPETAKP